MTALADHDAELALVVDAGADGPGQPDIVVQTDDGGDRFDEYLRHLLLFRYDFAAALADVLAVVAGEGEYLAGIQDGRLYVHVGERRPGGDGAAGDGGIYERLGLSDGWRAVFEEGARRGETADEAGDPILMNYSQLYVAVVFVGDQLQCLLLGQVSRTGE